VLLNPSVMGTLDGNNSLKRFVRVQHQADGLKFNSDYFLPHEYMDQFKHKVKHKVHKLDDAEVWQQKYSWLTRVHTLQSCPRGQK